MRTRKVESSVDVEVFRSLDALETIRAVWEELLESQAYPIVNAHPDRYRSVIEAHGDEIEPYVIVLRRDSVRAIVVSRLERRTLQVKVGWTVSVSPQLRCLTVVHGGLLGDGDPETYGAMLDAIDGQLRGEGLYAAYFNHVMDPVFFDVTRVRVSGLRRTLFPQQVPHWRMRVSESLDAFYAQRSAKHRKHLRAYVRKLEKRYPGSVEMVTYTDEDQVDRAVKDTAAISRKTYQSALGVGFEDTPAKRTLLTMAARKGWLRGHILYVEGRPVAYRFALCYRGTYFADGTGYDPEWRHFRVGTVLFLKVLEHMCAEGVRYYDFGFGDAEYKQHYADESWEDSSLFVFAPRVGAVALNVLHSSLAAAVLGIRAVFVKLGWLGGVKRQWRRRLERRQ